MKTFILKTNTFIFSFLGILLLGVNLCTAEIALAKTEETPAQHLKNLLQPLQTIQGHFEQKVANGAGSIVQTGSGTLFLKKPALFRWEFSDKLIVSDGKQVWDYDHDLAQVTVYKLNRKQLSAPIFFLTGNLNALEKDFKIRALIPSLSKSDTSFELIPKSDNSSFQWVKVGFKNQVLSEMEMLDHLGQKSHIIFSQVKLNENIPADKFSFTPKEGTDVIKGEGA